MQVEITLFLENQNIIFVSEKNNIDLGVNISDDLEELRNKLNKYKKSHVGGDLDDIDIEKLDWMEDNKRMKAFIIYETSV